MIQKLKLGLLVALCSSLLGSLNATAQEINLPENPAAWLNSPPITNQHLEGKAAFLCFFEEG